MKRRLEVRVHDYQRASALSGQVKLGHWFAFASDAGLLGSKGGRAARLQLAKAGGGKAVPVIEPLELPGVTIHARSESFEPLGCVVPDRDLYRAGEDVARLFVAVPSAPKDVRLAISHNGALLTEREIDLEDGVAVEALDGLLPGSYSVQLKIGTRTVGVPATFTAAEYSLAPLAGCLDSHRIARGQDQLEFALEVESWQVPLDRKLKVTLVDGEREVDSRKLDPTRPGRFEGSLKMKKGEGPFRLRLEVTGDAERICEVAIPGSRKSERSLTVVSELAARSLSR